MSLLKVRNAASTRDGSFGGKTSYLQVAEPHYITISRQGMETNCNEKLSVNGLLTMQSIVSAFTIFLCLGCSLFQY